MNTEREEKLRAAAKLITEEYFPNPAIIYADKHGKKFKERLIESMCELSKSKEVAEYHSQDKSVDLEELKITENDIQLESKNWNPENNEELYFEFGAKWMRDKLLPHLQQSKESGAIGEFNEDKVREWLISLRLVIKKDQDNLVNICRDYHQFLKQK